MHKPLRLGLALLVMAAFLAASGCSVSAATSIDASEIQKIYPPNTPLAGDIKLKYDNVLPDNTVLKAYIDGSMVSSLAIGPIIKGAPLQYKQYSFTYTINAAGENRWDEHPDKSFYYKIKATGTCGNQECATAGNCDCGCTPPSYPPYTCAWEMEMPDFQPATVNADAGLMEIIDGNEYITPSASASDEIYWSQTNPTPSGVQTTMRTFCGGWQRATLQNGVSVPNQASQKKFTVDPFDDASIISPGREQFPEGDCTKPYTCGGIYKSTGTLTTRLTQPNSQFSLNGSIGEIIIKSYDPKATYAVTFLPPNGPMLCAYTSYAIPNYTQWSASSAPQSGSVAYGKNFSVSFNESQLPMKFNDSNKLTALIWKSSDKPPECPDYAFESCNQTVVSYDAVKASDTTPKGTIEMRFISPRNITAIQTSQDIMERFVRIGASNFSRLKTPASVGDYGIYFTLESSGTELAPQSQTITFSVCDDKDGDGHCTIETGGDDCDDLNASIHPGAFEPCQNSKNPVDYDCDNQTNEDFYRAGKRLGDSCGVGTGGNCSGKWVCSKDGKDVECNTPAKPTQEICGDGIDNDCDGVTDEIDCIECTNGQLGSACGSNIGECRNGSRICVNGHWDPSACPGKKSGSEEVCNGKDDNCDGIIDNVGVSIGETSSVKETQCGCYNGAAPSAETCDGVDNDCNGQIDEGLNCFQNDQTRPCGPFKGICRQGTQTFMNGQWGECMGGIKPNPDGEICYNGLDDNCNGKTDAPEEGCTPSFTCHNGIKDTNEDGTDCGGACKESCGIPYNWLLFAGGIILLILAVALLELKGVL